MSNLKKFAAIAFAAAAVMGLTGCDTAPEANTATVNTTQLNEFEISDLKYGFYNATIMSPGAEDTNCLIFKDTYGHMGFAGMDCDIKDTSQITNLDDQTMIAVEKINNAEISDLDFGMHKISVTDHDTGDTTDCVVIKDTHGHGGFGTMSCDFN